MSGRERRDIPDGGIDDVAVSMVIVFLGTLGGAVSVLNDLGGVFEVLFAIGVGGVGGLFLPRWLGSWAPAGGNTVSRLAAPRSLRWVGGLLPSDEGAAWLAEVGSCLAETHDKGERRRYVRSYRRSVPQLIWTSWPCD